MCNKMHVYLCVCVCVWLCKKVFRVTKQQMTEVTEERREIWGIGHRPLQALSVRSEFSQ